MNKISLIVAQSENRVIGINNQLPWHIPEDLKHFKKVTAGHPIIMGRKTYESIGKLLPNRTNIILSRKPDYHVDGAKVCDGVAAAISLAKDSPGADEIFIIGGGDIFLQAMGYAQRIYLTIVHQEIQGDAFFPLIPKIFQEKNRQEYKAENNRPAFSILMLER